MSGMNARSTNVPMGTANPQMWRGLIPMLFGATVALVLVLALDREGGTRFWMFWIIGVCLFYAVRDPVTGLCLLALSTPFEFIFYGWGVGRYNTIAYLAIAMGLIWFVLLPRFRAKIKKHEWLFIALLTWSAITLLWADNDPERGVGILFTYAGLFVVLVVFSRGITDLTSVIRVLWYLVIGVMGEGAIMLLYYQTSTWVTAYGNAYMSTFGGADEVSHYEFGNAAIVAFVACLGLSEFDRSVFRRRIALVCALLLGTSIMLTLGRSLALELVMASVAWVVFTRRFHGKLRKATIASAIVAVTVGAGILINPGALALRWNMSLAQLESGDVRGFTTGRSVLWQFAIEEFRENPLAGIGIGQIPAAYRDRMGELRGTHSQYLAMLAETGVVGFVLWVVLFVALGVKAWQADPWRHLALAWWVYYVIELAGHSAGRNKAFWIVAGITVAISYQVRAHSGRIRPSPAPTVQRATVGL